LVSETVTSVAPNAFAAIGACGPTALEPIVAADSRLDLGRVKLSVNLAAKHPKISLQGAPRRLGAVAVMTSGNQSSQFF
jgi:hypothetical protein